MPISTPTSLAGVRIGLLVYGDIEQRTGGNIYDRELLRGLVELGATGTIMALRDPRTSVGVGATVPETIARIRDEQFDVLLQDELCHPALNQINAAVSSGEGPLRIAIVHNLGYKTATGDAGDLCKRSEYALLRGVDGCVVNSHFTLREIEALAGRAPASIVAYPFVGPDLLVDPGSGLCTSANGRATHIVSVANLSAVKGVHYLLDALALLRDRRWTLELVGSTVRDARYARSIEDQIDALDLRRRVQMSGELRGDSLRAAYERADVMVLASPQEGFGMVCLEAMRFGRPVIASSNGAAPELIRHEEHGLLVDPTDHDAFVATLRRVFTQPELMPVLGGAARARVLDHPTWGSVASQVATFLRGRQSARTA